MVSLHLSFLHRIRLDAIQRSGGVACNDGRAVLREFSEGTKWKTKNNYKT